jgi:dTDP-4-dehydrorhamnose 3,5-epimerase
LSRRKGSTSDAAAILVAQTAMTDLHFDEFAKLDGCFFGKRQMHLDERGEFVKVLDRELRMQASGFVTREIFVNRSRRGVVRGFHLQWPPAHHAKFVTCLDGAMFDVLLDLRRSSATFRRFAVQRMEPGDFAFIPAGIAHAFQALVDDSTMLYAIDSDYVPALDGGVNPLSCPIEWPVDDPVVSQRDHSLPSFADLDCHFD